MEELRILLVEDNPGDARLVRELLRDIGDFRCEETVVDRLELLPAALERGRFDVILLDLLLPDARELDTLRAAVRQSRGVPIVVLTGLDDGVVAVEALREGAQDYLVKGEYDGRALCRTLRHAVERGRLERELRFLAEAGELLTSDLDYESTLREVARLSVPSIADWCVVDVLDEDGVLQSVQLAAADPAKEAPLRRMLERFPHAPSPPTHPVQRVLTARQPLLVHEVTADFLAASVADDIQLEMLSALAPGSAMFVPLTVRAQVLGALTLVASESGRRFAPHDLWLAGELARRAAVAIENARLYQRARAATHARDEVLAVVAHDLRNPLSAVTMIGALLLEGRLTPAQTQEQLQAMLRSTEEMDRLIEDLLDVARIDSGTLAVNPSPTALESLIPDVLQQVGLAASRKSVRIEADMEPDLPAASADSVRVVQVLSNLLANAVRHSPPSSSVFVRAARLGREIVLSVTDEGDGIAPENMSRLFDRFWQAGPRSREGAGLGLSIARGIVEAHGGRIWASSAPGEGATFFFTLPVANAPVEERGRGGERASLPVDPIALPSERPIRLILVDDHPALRRGVRSVLGRASDMELVGEAGTAEEGIALAERLHPDVVLMDLSLPGLAGVDAIRLLTARDPAVRVLALTAVAEEDSVLAVLEAGGHGFVHKEAAYSELVTAVRTVARDEVFLHPRGNRALVDSIRRAVAARERDALAILSEQERRILTLVAEGFNASEIGKRLFLSASTVASYRSHAMRALGLHDRASLIHLLLERGLLKARGGDGPAQAERAGQVESARHIAPDGATQLSPTSGGSVGRELS